MASDDIFLTMSLIFGITTSVAFLYLYIRFAKQRRILAMVSKDLDRVLCCLNGVETREEAIGFASSLDEAKIKTKLNQNSTDKHLNKSADAVVPERYRHVSMLADHGLDKDAISAILKIPQGETEQLLKLCHLTGQCA